MALAVCKHPKRFPYKKLEDAIFDSIHEINIKKVIPDTNKDELAELNEKILAAHSKSKRSEQRKLDLLRNFEHDEAAKSVIDELTAEIDGLYIALRGYKER